MAAKQEHRGRADANRIKSLVKTLAELIEHERRAYQALISSLLDSVKTIQGDTADRRLYLLTTQVKVLGERIDLLSEMARRDFLTKIEREAGGLTRELSDSRAAGVLMSAFRSKTTSLSLFCETLLDSLIEATGAERGFVLFYLPESTEAEVVAARNFQTRNLSLEEYDFSRTLLTEVLQRGRPLFLEDASHDPTYSFEASVIKFELKSIVAAPLKRDDRTIGALYLENNSHPCAFGEPDAQLLEAVAEFIVFYLQHARLLPVALERDSRVFFDDTKAFKEIIGRDPKIVRLLEAIKRLADSPATVLIEGESGTGKELVARALHYQSSRRDRPFVAINCAAIPDNLLESELFGHEKGAFTGASGRYIGRIEQGNGGTIFLDEVSELAYPLQAKLLRVLQSSEFDRLGGSRIRVDVRVVAATSKDLKALTEAGKFQDALFYRLNVIPVRVPSLRERKSDIPLLIDFFLDKFSGVYSKPVRVEPDVCEWLKDYPFPGNVRELENLIHRLVALASEDTIRIRDLPREILQTDPRRIALLRDPLYQILQTPPINLADMKRRRAEIKRHLAAQERQLIERAIQEAGGNVTEAATRFGLHRATVHKLLGKSKKKS
jgi:Nif-specific regulatory protein